MTEPREPTPAAAPPDPAAAAGGAPPRAGTGAAATGTGAAATGAGEAATGEAATGAAAMDLVIVTGLSGAGRSTVARALENVGYYVVDNLPQALMVTMAELASASGGAARRTAIVLDVRSRAFSTDLLGAVAELRARAFHPRIVFLEAADAVLIQRFESVRRPHPMQGEGRLADGITAERTLLLDAREAADVVIDTTMLNVNQLRSRTEELFGAHLGGLQVTVLSFGFKYGLPADADMVVDMRFLPNPHWIPELRPFTGEDPRVSAYVFEQPGAASFLDRYAELVVTTAAGYQREGKRYLTIGVGCTGGKHRSVASAVALAARLAGHGLAASVVHRDLGRE